jgi:hypothetical protein
LRRTATSARTSKPTIRGRRRAYSNFWSLPRRLKMANIRGPSLGLLPNLARSVRTGSSFAPEHIAVRPIPECRTSTRKSRRHSSDGRVMIDRGRNRGHFCGPIDPQPPWTTTSFGTADEARRVMVEIVTSTSADPNCYVCCLSHQWTPAR